MNDVVYAYMCEAQEGHHEDFMRAFFRLRVVDIGRVVRKVIDVTANTAKETGRAVFNLLPEANRIVLVRSYKHLSCVDTDDLKDGLELCI